VTAVEPVSRIAAQPAPTALALLHDGLSHPTESLNDASGTNSIQPVPAVKVVAGLAHADGALVGTAPFKIGNTSIFSAPPCRSLIVHVV
jgi:hypothetical protein